VGSRFKGIESKAKARFRRELASKLTEAAQEFQRRQKLKKREKEHLHGDLPKDNKPVVSDAFFVDKKKFDAWVEGEWKHMFPNGNKKRARRGSTSEMKDSGRGVLRTIAEAFRFSVARRSDDSSGEKAKESQEREEQSKPTKKVKRESTSSVDFAQEERFRSSGSDAKKNRKASETRRDSKERQDHKLKTERPESKMTKREKDVGQVRVIRSMDDFDRALKRYPEFRYRENFEKEHSRIRQYFESDESSRRHVPKMLSFIEKKELHLAYERAIGHSPEVRIESMQDVDRLLGEHDTRRQWKGFKEDYRKATVYFEVRSSREKTTELAKIHNIPRKRISEFKKLAESALVSSLRRMEEQRIAEKWAESNLESYLKALDKQVSEKREKTPSPRESSINPISPVDTTHIRDKLSKIGEGNFKAGRLTDAAEEMAGMIAEGKAGLSFIEIDKIGLKKQDVRNLTQIIEDKHQDVESALQERLKLSSTDWEFRFGTVENRIYLWKLNKTLNDMLNVWSNHYFYFNQVDIVRMLDDFGRGLQLPDGRSHEIRHFNGMIQSLVSEVAATQVKVERGQSRLRGDALHLYRDVLGLDNHDFHGKMVKVASRFGRGPIYNPRLPKGKELELLRSQFGAAVNSDCWLGGDGRMFYYEANLNRIKIVQKQLQKFGDIELRLQPMVGRSYRMLLPRPIGKAFISWEFSTDDKSLKNERLSRFIREGDRDAWIAYHKNLIPEDGSVTEETGFQWSRSIVLNPGIQDAKYGLRPQLSEQDISIIRENGRRDEKRGYIHLQLSAYLKSDNESKFEAIKRMESVISNNRSKLIDDESDLAKKLGIEMRVYPESITLYEGTGRIAIKWVAKTKDTENAIKWWLLAPPNDVRKNGIVKNWLLKIPSAVQRVQRQLEDEGLLKKK